MEEVKDLIANITDNAEDTQLIAELDTVHIFENIKIHNIIFMFIYFFIEFLHL